MVSKPNIGDTGWGTTLNAALDALDAAVTTNTAAVGQRWIVVSHGSTASTARPTSSLPVMWQGTVAPTNGITRDRWYDETTEVEKRYDGTTWQIAGKGTYESVVVVTGTGIDYTGATDSGAAVAALITAAHTAAGTNKLRVVFQPGTLKSSVPLPAYSKTEYDMRRTRINYVTSGGVSSHAFYDAEGATLGSPMTDTLWRGGELDGSGIAGATSKGFYISHMLRPKWIDVYVHDFPATGFGADYLRDYLFSYCKADSNGRLGNVGDAGMSGFGIGTGDSAVEAGLMIGCTGSSNKNYGAFWEQQNVANGGSPLYSTGMRMFGCEFRSNNVGIGECGVSGLIVQGCIASSNTQDGFQASQGTGGGIGAPGLRGLIQGNVFDSNGRYGVFLDYRFKATGAIDNRYVVRGNQIRSSGTTGIQVSTDTAVLSGITVTDNDVALSNANGIQISVISTGSFIDLTVADNRVRANGQTNVSGFAQGIRIIASGVRSHIRRNHCWDDGGTKKQTYGITIDASSTQTDPVISDNDVRGNLTGGMQQLATLAGLAHIRNNRGFNPQGFISGPAVPASTSNYTNILGYDCTVYITGGTVTAVTITGVNGTATATGLTSGAFRVPPGESIAVTYSVAPTWTWFAD